MKCVFKFQDKKNTETTKAFIEAPGLNYEKTVLQQNKNHKSLETPKPKF